MGLSYVEMHYLVFQKEALRLNECRRVLDIGLQEVQAFGHSEFVHNFIQAFSPDTNVASQDLDHLNTHCFLYDIFEYIDAEYVCYEVDGKRPYTFFDLNFDTVSDEHRGKFDLVLNFGTSEHVMNQYNFYKTVHDACAVGGHMIHSIPFSGLTNHGFFNTNPKFLINLAGLNGYELLDMNMTITREPSGIDEYILNYLNQDSDFLAYANQTGLSRVKDNFKATDSQLRVTLKKTKDTEFVPAVDVEYLNRSVFVTRSGKMTSHDFNLPKLLDVPADEIAIIPAGGEVRSLPIFDTPARQVGVIFDNDPDKDGTTIRGVPVKKAPKHPDDLKMPVSVIIICSHAYESEIKAQLAPFEANGTRLITKSELCEMI